MRIFLLVSMTVLLTACGNAESLNKLRSVTPTGDAYTQALSKEYLTLAEYLEQKRQLLASQHFADKGLRAAYGNTVTLDPLPIKSVVGDVRYDQLIEGREMMDRVLSAEAKQANPTLSARAYALYDCWINAAAQYRGDTVEYCQEEYLKALQKLHEPVAEAAAGAAPAAPAVSTSYLLFFDWDSMRLTQDAMQRIGELIADIKKMGKVTITINGHADRSGSESYNMQLSQRRAEAVRAQLTAAGIAQTLIAIFAFGESDPMVPTDDGIRESRNRRVEVFLE